MSTSRARRWRPVWWTLGVLAMAALVAMLSIGIWLSSSLNPDPWAPPTQPGSGGAAPSVVQGSGTADETLRRFEEALAQTADQIVALQPGSTWRWNHDSTTVSCLDQAPAPPRVQILTRQLSFDGPIPDTVWPAARDIVRQRAAALGAGGLFVYVDRSGDHDLAFTSDTGVEVRFGTRVAAVLSARSDCVHEDAHH